jgi:NAD-dependent DNA ligase
MTREEAKSLARDLGAQVTPANKVSQSTNLVIAGETNKSQLKIAKKKDIEIMSPTDFYKLVLDHSHQ